jgi:hypothetical protein
MARPRFKRCRWFRLAGDVLQSAAIELVVEMS